MFISVVVILCIVFVLGYGALLGYMIKDVQRRHKDPNNER